MRWRVSAARLVTTLILLALAGCGGDSGTSTAIIETVSPAEAAEIIGEGRSDLVILDVRTPDEFAAGHLSDAVNLDYYSPSFADSLAVLDRDATYVLYCRTGNRSAEVREMMRGLGFAEVHEIAGGFVAWDEAGRPYESFSPGI
ncbi:MAG TPA: rhodanese-like domain-containing protein [Acidimicrobiia bacterium]|nr:rhodanese-like domain-containing protein [Acidimicrobiia bacterium]